MRRPPYIIYRKRYYIPESAFLTAAARRIVLEAAQKTIETRVYVYLRVYSILFSRSPRRGFVWFRFFFHLLVLSRENPLSALAYPFETHHHIWTGTVPVRVHTISCDIMYICCLHVVGTCVFPTGRNLFRYSPPRRR